MKRLWQLAFAVVYLAMAFVTVKVFMPLVVACYE